MAEYAAAYGGVPAPGFPWPLFLALVERAGRFEARARLRLTDAVAAGIGTALEGGHQADLARDELVRAAYPTTRTGPKMVPNLAREAPPDGE